MRLLFILCLIFVAITKTVVAQEETTEPPVPSANINIETAYAFATMPGSITGAVFMVLRNTGNIDDTLIDVKSDIATITEIHENLIDPDDGTMMMRKIKNIVVPAGGEVILEPKGKHIMLIKLEEPLTLDSTFPLTLIFEKSGKIEIDVRVIQPGTKPETENPEEHNHDHAEEPEEDDFPSSSFSNGDDL